MKTLPDYLRKGMKLIIVGCNPTEFPCARGIITRVAVTHFGQPFTKWSCAGTI